MTAVSMSLDERLAIAETRIEAHGKRVDEIRDDLGFLKKTAVAILICVVSGLGGALFQLLSAKH